MASWAVFAEQTVLVSRLATGFTIVCDRCSEEGSLFPSVHATLALEHTHGRVECPHGHVIHIERAGR